MLPRKNKKTKYIFITGGVLSGVGKGIAAASIGAVLKARGFKVNIQKCDPYLNSDAGTLNPGEHGEVFVTDDGAETDLDLGHYERFLGRNLDGRSSLMAGQIFGSIVEAERRGDFLGKTVQIVPHIVEEIEKRILETGKGYDVHITEIGGTVGDYEGLHFMEALRRIQASFGPEETFYIHVVFLPYLKTSNEVKTRPAQYSTKDLRTLGISPQIIMARSDYPINKSLIDKLSLYCGVEKKGIIPLETLECVYELPLVLESQDAGDYITEKLKLPKRKSKLDEWRALIRKIKKSRKRVKIGLVAKYLSNTDTYASVVEAIKSACWNEGRVVDIVRIDAEEIEKGDSKLLKEVSGIVVPGGFGNRGIEGKIKAAKFARENKVPYLGLCLGMQVAVIEFARHACRFPGANSTEFNNKTNCPVIYIMPSQRKINKKGGTMRLGSYPCILDKNSKVFTLYQTDKIKERHRHRYEFNNKYKNIFEKSGMRFSGLSPDKRLVEIIELKDHPFFIATQAHPEFKSRPGNPHPLFLGFVKAAIEKSKIKDQRSKIQTKNVKIVKIKT